MVDAQTPQTMSPKLQKVAEIARRDPNGRLFALAHLMDEEELVRSFRRVRNNAAVGVDGVTKEAYGQNLEANIQDLLTRLKAKRYRHQPIRRVHIPKDKGRTRPIGVSSIEDKVVQGAIREVLQAIYEQDFLNCSHGFRPNRTAHDAIRAIHQAAYRGEVQVVLEADVQSFFDSLNRVKLKEMLQIRIADGQMMRLIGKCLHVGILDGEEYSEPDDGTTQGSILSPLLGNIYLHYALDVWFERDIRPTLEGKAQLVRYADDFVILFEKQQDAERVQGALHQRMAEYDLTLHPDKTRLIRFETPPPSQGGGKGPGTFDFLGFTLYWRKPRQSEWWQLGCKTRGARQRRAIESVYEWCRRHRHLPMSEQHAALTSKLRGHINYFGVNGNSSCIGHLLYYAKHAWYKWLNRRSQRSKWNWESYGAYLQRHPLPQPRIIVQIWNT
jgi:group II intron reverse transcriptase/maturase